MRALCQKWAVVNGENKTYAGYTLYDKRSEHTRYIKKFLDEIPIDNLSSTYFHFDGKPFWIDLTPVLKEHVNTGLLTGVLPNPSDDQNEPTVDPWVVGAEAMREWIAQFYESAAKMDNGYVDPDEPDFIRSIPLPERTHA